MRIPEAFTSASRAGPAGAIRALLEDTRSAVATPIGARVADLGVNGFTPQLRLRYPRLDDRLVPYVVGGTGVARTNVNDTTEPVAWVGGSHDTRAVSTAGVGLEYFLRDNIAFGVE